MEQETRYQRIAREQAERQAARALRMEAEEKAARKAARASRPSRRRRGGWNADCEGEDQSVGYYEIGGDHEPPQF